MTTLTEHQPPLTGLELKEQGIASVSRHRWVDDARMEAERFCRGTGFVTSDDVHFIMDVDYPPHPNCVGAIFADKRFMATGERVRSTRPEAHGREIRVW
ncbi:hypothetical protein LCGC14_2563800 [marine sediment metagenome]|uniref:Uncharacterized protein n=1 Tax=marine sediment metagenome TaxID=412755 RepID=A0A0F9CVG0_9ZZZZ